MSLRSWIGTSVAIPLAQGRSEQKNFVTNTLIKLGILKHDLDYHLVRLSIVIVLLLFGYQNWLAWFAHEAQALIPYMRGPLISWTYPVLGIRDGSWFLGASEWLIAALLFAGFWNKKVGVLGAACAGFSFFATFLILLFEPTGWTGSGSGIPVIASNLPFLMNDMVLLSISVCLLRQEVLRVSLSSKAPPKPTTAHMQPHPSPSGATGAF